MMIYAYLYELFFLSNLLIYRLYMTYNVIQFAYERNISFSIVIPFIKIIEELTKCISFF